MNVRALIIDDEAPARRKLRSHLAAMDGIEVAGEASSGPEAVTAIRELQPDLVLLDIQMPGMTGFEVIAEVGVEKMPAVIFVTAYDEFAVEAFEVEALDYLLKPYTAARLDRALRRALGQVERCDHDGTALNQLLERVLPARRPLRRLVVRAGDRLLLVPMHEVLQLEAAGNYVKVHTPSGTHLLRDTLSHLETVLDQERFARVHRSIIVNLDAIREIQPYFHGDHVIVLKTGQTLRLSRRYRDRVLGSRIE